VATISNEQVSRAIDEIEQALESDDPALVRRVQALRRAERATAITVVTLLAGGAVLLTMGLATLSWIAWCAGAIALLAAAAVDERQKRVLQRTPGARDGHEIRVTPKRSRRSGQPRLGGVARRVLGPELPWLAWPTLPRRGDRRGWDERVVLACTMAEVTTHLRGPDHLAGWFPGVRRVHHDAGTDILVGGRGGMRLRALAERWAPDAGGTLEAAADGAVIRAHVTMRRVLVPAEHGGNVKPAVEVWVHAESDNSARGRRVLQRLRAVTRAGLRHMAAELSVA
jgi:hypothetical protein